MTADAVARDVRRPAGRLSQESVLIVASSFPPMASAAVYRTLRFARYLPGLNWDVHVLTMHPRWYEAGTPFDESLLEKVPRSVDVRRTMAVYPLHWLNRLRKCLRNRDVEKRDAHAMARRSTRASERSVFQRLKDLLTLPLMTPDRHIGWIPFAVRAGRKITREDAISVIYSSGPPWTNHLIADRLKRSTGKPWVADFRDPWIGSDFRPIRRSNTWIGRRHQRLERRVVEHASRIVVNTPPSRNDFLSRYGQELAHKLDVIPNGFDPADYDAVKTFGGKRSAKLTIAHAGSFYGKRNVRGLIKAIASLCHAGAIPQDELEVRLIGARRPARSAEEALVSEAGLAEVITLTPHVPHDECLRQLAAADVLLLVQVGAPLSVPGKVYEYIALSRPILALASQGATTDLVRREGLGLCVDPDDVEAIQGAILRLYKRFLCGENLPAVSGHVRDRYDGRTLTGQLDGVLRNVLEE